MVAKKQATKAVKATSTHVSLPTGYKPISSGKFAAKWDYEGDPLIEGTVLEIKAVDFGAGKNKRTTRVMTVELADGSKKAVWDSAALDQFFLDAKKGDRVAVAFQGYQALPGKKQPMKLFEAGIQAAPARKSR